MKSLVAIPVYNEEKYLPGVLRRILAYHGDVLIIDDGSTDRTPEVLEEFTELTVLRHVQNLGYGAALRHAFEYGCEHGYEFVVTIDGDGQHEPALIQRFVEACRDYDIVSGSRYARSFAVNTPVPPERRRINRLVTDELNACFDLNITDAFCGFKVYRTAALCRLRLTEDGYAMPLELWVQAAFERLRIREIAVPCIYLDPTRSFSETLDDADVRLAYYQRVIDAAVAEARKTADHQMLRAPTPVFQKADS